MEKLPRISIVTPSFNQASFVDETLRSVLEQGYPNLEYVVIDGASTDGSADIIAKHAPSLSYWVSEPDRGHGHALNKGFERTSGEVMGWLNSDDKYTPWALRTVGRIFAEFPHVQWIVGMNGLWNVDGAMIDAFRAPKNIFDFLTGHYKWIQQESVFWRRSLWEKAGGAIDESFKFMVDGELWTRFFLHAELYSLDCILGGFRQQPNGRALNNQLACEADMVRAIARMSARATNEVFYRRRRLRVTQAVAKYSKPAGRLIKQIYSQADFDKAAYHNIAYIEGKWTEKRVPYPL